jgi:glycerophosphoryl diester phosphodiesterase
MLDKRQFLRPIAHRGLHSAPRGIIENTLPAFGAAIARGYGIECDLRAAANGLPVVFHDDTLDRLTEQSGPVARLGRADLGAIRHKGSGVPIMTYDELLEMVAGRVPLLVEVKGEWEPPDFGFLQAIADASWRYHGPLALMSFDPAIVTALGALAPGVPRGIVSGVYDNHAEGVSSTHGDPEGWWGDKLSKERQERLTHLLESKPAYPDFYAYDVKSLPTPVTRYVREVLGLPLFTWTVRTDADRARAAQWADAPIFEGWEP